MEPKGKIKYYRLIIIGLILTVCASNIHWGGERWKDVITSDGKGYYAYLPALFIYKDLSFRFHDTIEKRYYGPNTYSEYRVQAMGKQVNKYTAGVALLQLPFFFSAHIVAMTTGDPMDGYSFPYQIAVNIAGIIYLLVGLYFLERWLWEEGIKRRTLLLSQLGLVFATPLFYYTVCEPAMSHCYSFAVISALCYQFSRFFRKQDSNDWLKVCLLIGMTVLIRPINGLTILAAPFLAGTPVAFAQGLRYLKSNPGKLLAGVVTGLAICALQPLLFYAQTGCWWIYTYGKEHLDLLQPHLSDFLFSYRKGFFLYTPFALLCLAGFIPLRKRPFRSLTLAAFLLVVVYVLSSWSVWWYGGSFSQRAMIDYLPFFAFLMAVAVDGLSRMLKFGLLTLVFAALLLCQLQTYQYRYYLIHWEKMDKEHYWRVFLKTTGIGAKNNPNKDLL